MAWQKGDPDVFSQHNEGNGEGNDAESEEPNGGGKTVPEIDENLTDLLGQNPAIQKQTQARLDELFDKEGGQTYKNETKEDRMKDVIFENIVLSALQDVFEEALENAGFNKGDISEIRQSVRDLSADELKQVFAAQTAYENKDKMAGHVKELVEQGEININGVPEFLLNKAEDLGLQLGYHASNNEIEPQDGQWFVGGTEKDKNGRPKAHFSQADGRDWQNLYDARVQKERGDIQAANDYLYIVRATDSAEDRAGGWSNDMQLPIIARMDLDKISELLDDEVKRVRESNE